jgi:2-oxo-4-hydroxy-4-carboxy--5-ureidoimidazoline (OHCU) decarboxylase
MLPALEDLNGLDEEAFLAALTLLFEGRTPLGRGLFARRPFASYEALIEEAGAVCRSLSLEETHQVIDAHPRIGAPREALARVSVRSYEEQGYAAAPSAVEARVQSELATLNERYERRFGFRFVVFVNRRSQAAILPEFRARLGRGADEERRAALDAILAIARDRLSRFA